MIAEILQRSSHTLEIISQGSLEPQVPGNTRRSKFYPAFSEPERFHPSIPIHYASALSVRYLIGLWESIAMQRLLKMRHSKGRFDVVVIYNMQRAQIGCTRFAVRRLRLPVILQYEDDAFGDIHGQEASGLISRCHRAMYKRVLKSVSAGIAVSPYLMSQFPSDIPRLLLRGVVSYDILRSIQAGKVTKMNWVVFSGTHEETQGLEQLITAWRLLDLPDWELHIAGHGPLTPTLEKMAEGNPRIIFHGLLNREENARLICAAKIGMNPQDLSKVPGNVFAFKIVEYLAAGTHVITTPRGVLEHELEAAVSYIADNAAETIAACLKQVIYERRYECTAERAALEGYGPDAVSKLLNRLLEQVTQI